MMTQQQQKRIKQLSLPLVIAATMGTTTLADAKPLAPSQLLQQHAITATKPLQTKTEQGLLMHAELRTNLLELDLNRFAKHSFAPPTKNLLIRLAKGPTKSAAAGAAKRKYGGKVLKVSESGGGFKVKLLLDNGRVKVVTVDASGKVR